MKQYLLILLVGALYAVSSCAQADDTSLSVVSASGQKHEFTIELAVTPEQKVQGLMHRKMLAPQSGMLFLFGDPQALSFWMKDTLIPLDIIFIRKDGTINHIHPNAVPLDLSRISSMGPVSAVLEINGGEAQSLGIVPGDVVHHSAFGNKLAE
jgi:uncharacterized membrane protein (UPF0127 family)